MNKRPPSDTSLEAFYDFAHEVGSGGKERIRRRWREPGSMEQCMKR